MKGGPVLNFTYPLFNLSLLLFWTPIILVLHIKRKAFFILWRIIYEKGFITPFLFRMCNKSLRSFVSEFDALHQYFISSLTKGESDMGRIYGIKPDQVQEFEPKGQDDVPVKERLIFLTKSLDVNLSAQITDQVYTAKGFGKGREELLRAGTQEIEILRRGLVGWKNFAYEGGEEIKWHDVPQNVSRQKFNSAMDINLNKINPELRGEIADFIRGTSTADSD